MRPAAQIPNVQLAAVVTFGKIVATVHLTVWTTHKI